MATKGPKRATALYPEGPLEAPDRDTGKGGSGGAHPGGRNANRVDSYEAAIARAFGNVNATSIASAAAAAAAAASAKRARSSEAGGGAAGAAAGAGAAAVVVGHAGSAVRGLGIDSLNSVLVSCDARGRVLFWDFGTHELRGELALPCGASSLKLHRDSGLAAMSCDDFVVRVVDVNTRRLVRTFSGHSNRVLDVAFSPDSRWLVTASLDSSVRVWDLPTGRCVDWMGFARAPTAVAFSPTDEVLVTAHVDTPGLALWSNKVHFGVAGASASAGAGAAPAAPVMMDAPRVSIALAGGASASSSGDGGDESGETEEESRQRGHAHGRELHAPSSVSSLVTEPPSSSGGSVHPRADCGLTLSGLPTSAWQNLTRLDLIAARNKPILPPTKPAAAPFFLATTGGLNPVFVAPASGGAPGAVAAGPAEGADADTREEEWAGSAAWTDADEQVPSSNDAVGAGAAPADGKARVDGEVEVSGRLIRSLGARVNRSVLASLLRDSTATNTSGGSGSGSAAAESSKLSSEVSSSVASHLASLAPSAVDVEVRSLCLGKEDDDGMSLLRTLLAHFELQIRSGQQFDLVQAQLALTLQIYSEVIAGDGVALETAERIRTLQGAHVSRLGSLLDKGLCMIGSFLRQ